jgi:hypothetical protein
VAQLKRVRPYHRRRARCYHDRADCPVGQLIRSAELIPGTGGRSRCEECRALDPPTPRAPRRRPGELVSEPLVGPYAV